LYPCNAAQLSTHIFLVDFTNVAANLESRQPLAVEEPDREEYDHPEARHQ
jgi:hypothetical protein